MMSKTSKIALVCVTCVASVLGAAFLAPPIARFLGTADVPAWLGQPAGMGPERVFGRLCLLFLAFVVVGAALAFGVRRSRDLGWHGGRRWVLDMLQGWAAGFAMLGLIGVLSVACGARRVVPPGWSGLPTKIPDFVRFGFGAALFEETLFRGLFLLAFVRAGRARTGVLVTSLLYATAHWLRPPGSSEEATAFSILQGVVSALATLPPEIVRWSVLFLAAVALCVAVLRTGRIGWAVGLHAGWVMGLKALVFLTDTVVGARCPRILFGGDGALEGVVAVALMAALAAALLRLPRDAGEASCSVRSSG